MSAPQPASRSVSGSEIGFSRSDGKADSKAEGKVLSVDTRLTASPVASNASGRASPTVERSSPSTPPRIPEDETGSRLLGVAVIALQEAFANRASSALERAWGAVGAALERVGATTREILQPVASFLAGARPAGDLGGRGPPEGLPAIPSGTGLLAGNSLSSAGASGGGFELLAVLAVLAVAARRGRFWAPYAIPKPGLVPRLMPERPG